MKPIVLSVIYDNDGPDISTAQYRAVLLRLTRDHPNNADTN